MLPAARLSRSFESNRSNLNLIKNHEQQKTSSLSISRNRVLSFPSTFGSLSIAFCSTTSYTSPSSKIEGKLSILIRADVCLHGACLPKLLAFLLISLNSFHRRKKNLSSRKIRCMMSLFFKFSANWVWNGRLFESVLWLKRVSAIYGIHAEGFENSYVER